MSSSAGGTIKKTYLRYECADTFSLMCDVGSSCSSSQILSCVEQPYPHTSSTSTGSSRISSSGATASEPPPPPPVVFTVCKSNCLGFHLRRAGDGVPFLKLGHRDPSSIGTGRALNSEESTCIQVFSAFSSSAMSGNDTSSTSLRVATGWMEGSIRIFTINREDLVTKGAAHGRGVIHSLLQPSTTTEEEEFVMREPLVFKGHYGSPVTCLSIDRATGSRFASGGSDGSVIVWDLIAETGLFRLRGHKRPISHLSFIPLSPSFDGLVSASLDGLVKIWDLDGQCCTQTITTHRAEVWSADTTIILDDDNDGDKNHSFNDSDDVNAQIPYNKIHRWRLITGSSDVQLRVWDLRPPTRVGLGKEQQHLNLDTNHNMEELSGNLYDDTVAFYMGSIHRQTNERVALLKFHPSGKFFGVSAHGSKQVELYVNRSIQDTQKRRKRRWKRRREKKESATTDKISNSKKGILDDDDDESDIVHDRSRKQDEDNRNNNDDDDGLNMERLVGSDDTLTLHPDAIKASDEIQLLGIIQGSQKIKSFTFSPTLERGKTVARIILALTTNALEIHTIALTANDG